MLLNYYEYIYILYYYIDELISENIYIGLHIINIINIT